MRRFLQLQRISFDSYIDVLEIIDTYNWFTLMRHDYHQNRIVQRVAV